MRFLRFAPLLFALLCTPTAFSQSTTDAQSPAPSVDARSAFQSGVEAFQKGDLKAARASFESVLHTDPSHVVTLFDLGLIEQKEGRNGRALALWRKALVEAPEFSPARDAVRWTRKKLERAAIPHEVEMWEQLRESALAPVVLEKYVVLAAGLFALAVWLLLGHVGARRRARLDEKPMPSFPFVAVILVCAWLVFTGLTFAKLIDMQELRATIIDKKVEARSTPDASATILFDLYEGLEVIVQQTKDDWIQVTYPGGSTGWVPRTAVLTTADRVVP